MDLEAMIKEIEDGIERNNSALASVKANLVKARIFTAKFLNECGKVGITKVAIRKEDRDIPSSKNWPFYHGGSVFAFGKRKDEGFPPIWGVVERMGISSGCGNDDQHQIVEDPDTILIDGVYHLQSGKWIRVS